MIKRKSIKNKGKINLSLYFQEFKIGDRVSVVREHSLNPKFPKAIQGRTGTIIGERGRDYIVKIKDGNLEKMYIIKSAHLKKLNSIE